MRGLLAAARHGFIRAVAIAAMVVATYGATTVAVDLGLIPRVMMTNVAPSTVAPALPAEPPLANVLIEKHDCWTGPAPAGVTMPGHVVATLPDGRTVYSAELVGPALDQVISHVEKHLIVHGFCR